MVDRVFLLAFCLCHPIPRGDSDDKLNAVRSMAVLAEENRLKFRSGSLEFRYLDGFCDEGDWSREGLRDSFVARGKVAWDDAQASYAHLFDEEDLHRASSPLTNEQVSSRIDNIRLLTDGKHTLFERIFSFPDRKISRAVALSVGSQYFYSRASIPMSVGVPEQYRDDLYVMYKRISEGSPGFAVQNVVDEEADGVKALKFDLSTPYGKRAIWIDPERGGTPVLVRYYLDEKSTLDVHVGDQRFIEGRGWFPFRRTAVLPGGRVKRLIVSEARFGAVPPSSFQMDFPEPVPVFDSEKKVSYPARKTWSLANLPSATAPGVIKYETIPDPPMPEVKEPRPYFTIVATCAAVVIVIVYFWRRGKGAA